MQISWSKPDGFCGGKVKNEDRRRYRKQRRIFIKNSKRRYSGQGDGRAYFKEIGERPIIDMNCGMEPGVSGKPESIL